MRYKTSCFNPTLARHNLRRFWPLPVLIFLFFALVMVTNYYTSMVSGGISTAVVADPWTSQAGVIVDASETEWVLRSARQAVYTFGTITVIVQLFTAIVTALLVMLHIHSRKQIQFYHGLPMKRRCIYITNVVTGGLMALVPVLLAEGIMLLMAASFDVELFPVFQLMGITAVSFIMFYAMAVLACVLAGQTFGAVLIYAGMNCVVVALLSGGAGIARYIMPGFDDYVLLEQAVFWLTPVMQLVRHSSPVYTETGLGLPYGFYAPPFLIYTVVALLLLVLGGFIYQKRKGETAGEMIAFPVIRVLCVALVALMAGFGGTVVLVSLINPIQDFSFRLIGVMVLGLLILGWIAAEMVTRKTFRVFGKKSVLSCLSLVALTLVVLLGAKYDVTGYVNRTPDMDRVVSAQLMCSGLPVEVEPEDALEFHEFILEHKEGLANSTSPFDCTTIHVDYYREDGTELLSRTYQVAGGPETTIAKAFMELMGKPEYVYGSWFTWEEEPLTTDRIEMSQVYSAHRYEEAGNVEIPYLLWDKSAFPNGWRGLNAEEGMLLYEAICRDIEAGNMETHYVSYLGGGEQYYGTVEYQVFAEPYDPSWGTYEEYRSQVSGNYHNISIYPSMTYTLAALEELGFTVNPEALK